MLSEEQIRQALHAGRVVPLAVAKPHDPLGLEQLAVAVARINPALGSGDLGMCRPVALDHATWEKLEQLADTATQTTSQRVPASQVDTAIIERFVAVLPQQDETQE